MTQSHVLDCYMDYRHWTQRGGGLCSISHTSPFSLFKHSPPAGTRMREMGPEDSPSLLSSAQQKVWNAPHTFLREPHKSVPDHAWSCPIIILFIHPATFRCRPAFCQALYWTWGHAEGPLLSRSSCSQEGKAEQEGAGPCWDGLTPPDPTQQFHSWKQTNPCLSSRGSQRSANSTPRSQPPSEW